MTELREHTIMANGLKIHYAEQGQGQPLILLHGGTANWQMWQAHMPLLAQHFRVLAMDSRGHGKTENPSGALSYRVMAEDVVAFAQALNIEKPNIMGYSDGGHIALEIGVRYPDFARALVIGGATAQPSAVYYDFLRSMGFTTAGTVTLEHMQSISPEWVAYLQNAHPRENDPDYWQKLLKQISGLWWSPILYTDEDLQKIAAPSLIFIGDREEGITLEEAVGMYRKIPDAALMILPDATHGNFGAPAMQLILEFLMQHKDH